ncbi:hypothetical protein Lwor_0071 [Legionella worsleiensis]|uniref:Uncharacterized protein n=1 Tax=Legionella worsleiensis TaxID=45076 RepID=A0A0W1ALE7_9GAMM|nr:hypothetical protein Lwor_0071 [Legionella worsleiensis]
MHSVPKTLISLTLHQGYQPPALCLNLSIGSLDAAQAKSRNYSPNLPIGSNTELAQCLFFFLFLKERII